MRDHSDKTVRTMRAGDAGAAAELMREVIQGCDYYNEAAKAEQCDKYDGDYLRALAEDDPYAVLTAGPPERPTGFCVSQVDGGVIWLDWIGVRHSARRQGVAAALLNELIESAPRRGCHKIWCDSRIPNVESAAALQAAGFRRLCELRAHWNRQDFYLWERVIDAELS